MDEAVVETIIARVMTLLNGEPIGPSPRRVIMLFSGAMSGFAAGEQTIKRLVGSRHRLRVMLTPAAKHLFTEKPIREAGAADIIDDNPWLDVPALIQQTDLVLVPTLTMNLAARLALGIMDTAATTLVLGALLAGKQVIGIRNGADPSGKRGEALGARREAAPVLWAVLERHLATLASFGMELVDKDEFLLTVERALIHGAKEIIVHEVDPAAAEVRSPVVVDPGAGAPRLGFVTENELLTLKPESVLRLARGRRLTAQAQDTARRLELRLEYA
jgi:hypothetical protein